MTNSTSKTNAPTQTQPFSAEQRKGIAQLLADAKERVESGLESHYHLDERIKVEILPKLAKEYGAFSQIKKVQRLRKECEDAETTLGNLGFDCNKHTGQLSISGKAPKTISQALEEAQRSARKERDAQLLKYDKAILEVWAVQNTDKARDIVEGLL